MAFVADRAGMYLVATGDEYLFQLNVTDEKWRRQLQNGEAVSRRDTAGTGTSRLGAISERTRSPQIAERQQCFFARSQKTSRTRPPGLTARLV